MQPKVFVCVPTFREPNQVRELLRSMRYVKYRPLELIIINANPGDETSQLISEEARSMDYSIREESGRPNQYWSATVNRGLRLIAQKAANADWVLLINIDITFDYDLVGALFKNTVNRVPCHLGALGCTNSIAVTSGVKVRSWALTLNRHPFAGFAVSDIPKGSIVAVDMLPSRCMFFPVTALKKAGLMSERLLPHYGADNEFSRRLSRLGYTPYLCGDVRFESDAQNSGKSVFKNNITFRERLSNLMDIKNPANPKYRTYFIMLAYPICTVPTAVIIYLLRTVLEVCLGGILLKRLVSGHEHGFSE